MNQYTAAGPASFTYDPNGNLQTDGTWYYVYDVENRLIAVDNGRNTRLRYDPLGRLYELADNISRAPRDSCTTPERGPGQAAMRWSLSTAAPAMAARWVVAQSRSARYGLWQAAHD